MAPIKTCVYVSGEPFCDISTDISAAKVSPPTKVNNNQNPGIIQLLLPVNIKASGGKAITIVNKKKG
ncbi:MAG: hypothetical protein V4619_07970 [Bacteroidota bacterium]